jgi:cobaltochelatase CobS
MLSRFDNESCARCRRPIRRGSPIERWHKPNGRETWVHAGCGASEPTSCHAEATSHNVASESLDALRAAVAACAVRCEGNENALVSFIGKLNELSAEIAKSQRVEIVIKRPKRAPVTLKESVHPIFADVLFHVNCGDNVMLVGPKGCGKTHLAAQIAKALELPYGMLSLSGGVTEARLFGRVVPNVQTGKSTLNRTDFLNKYEHGGVFLLDEIDAADPNVLLAANAALANGHLAIDCEETPRIERHKDFVCLAAANTWGNGADRQYVGRNQQDSAFTERFVQLPIDYDRELERKLAPKPELVEWAHSVRDNIVACGLERTLLAGRRDH